MSDPLVEKALDDLDNDYGGDMAEYLGEEWRDILRSHIQTAVDSATERLRGLLGEVLTAYKEQALPLRDEREPERYRRWAEELVTKVETELAAEFHR